MEPVSLQFTICRGRFGPAGGAGSYRIVSYHKPCLTRLKTNVRFSIQTPSDDGYKQINHEKSAGVDERASEVSETHFEGHHSDKRSSSSSSSCLLNYDPNSSISTTKSQLRQKGTLLLIILEKRQPPWVLLLLSGGCRWITRVLIIRE